MNDERGFYAGSYSDLLFSDCYRRCHLAMTAQPHAAAGEGATPLLGGGA